MENLNEKRVQQTIKEESKLYRAKLKAVKENRPILEKIGQLLEGMEFKSVYMTYKQIDLDLDSIGKARDITACFLENTDIEKFEKTTESRYDGLFWYYKANLNGVEVKVGPAPADRRCQPVKKEYTSSYWVCESKEK